MCKCKAHKCVITVEAQMTAQSISLPEVNRIRDSRVVAVQAHFNFPYDTGESSAYSPTNRPLFDNQLMQSTYINLVNANGTQIVSNQSLAHWQRGPYDQEPLAVNWTSIDLTQSSISVAQTPLLNLDDTTYSIMLDFFLDCNDCGVPE